MPKVPISKSKDFHTNAFALQSDSSVNETALIPPNYGIDFIDQPNDKIIPASQTQGVAQMVPASNSPHERINGISHLENESFKQMYGKDLHTSGVKVTYTTPSDKRLQNIGASSFTQGNNIVLGNAHDRWHEFAHLPQQWSGQVRANTEISGKAVNTEQKWERKADQEGQKLKHIAANLESSWNSQRAKNAEKNSNTHEEVSQRRISSEHFSTISSSKQPIQAALVKDEEILAERNGNFNWVKFRGERDNNDPNQVGKEAGRGTGVFFGGAQTSVTWQPVHHHAGEGTKMEAIIGPDHNLGSGPTEKNAKARVEAFSIFSGQSYISGHLLNEKLGGPGNDGRNLTAFSGSTNTLEASNIEKYVRDPVNEQGHWYKYIVEIDYAYASGIYKNSHKKIKDYNNLKQKPTGVTLTPHNFTQTNVQVAYASKLKAHWYQLNTGGGRFGPEYKRNIGIPSPLIGGDSAFVDPPAPSKKNKNPAVSPAPGFSSRGTAARTNISAEELVLTTSTILKSVVENREGLIKLLSQVRNDNDELKQTVEDLEALVDEYEYEVGDLRDWIYDYGYEIGYNHGQAAYFGADEKYDYYEDDRGNGSYSNGYGQGYNDGYDAAEQYQMGREAGEADWENNLGRQDMDSNYQNIQDSPSYESGYDYGWGYKDGYDVGYWDNQKWYKNNDDDYKEGYDEGYAQGQVNSIFAWGNRPVFQGITMVADLGGINSGASESFKGTTTVELTGKKHDQKKGFFGSSTRWYEVKIISSSNRRLNDSRGNTAWMKKAWFNKSN